MGVAVSPALKYQQSETAACRGRRSENGIMAKIGRNEPCPCGSSKKYKHCCGGPVGAIAAAVPAAPAGAEIPDRRAMERATADITRLLADQEFGSPEEAGTFLQRALAGGKALTRRRRRSPVEEAQDVMYDAWDASGERRVELARRALEISPDCADAYVLLAEETAASLDAGIELYAQGVAAGERALGERTFREETGSFWGMIETRPYMRARLGLAQHVQARGRRQEAIAHYRELLRLNPMDNQGVRYLLLPALLYSGDRAGAGELLGQFEDDGMAAWDYGRALYEYQVHGVGAQPQAALTEALKTNPYVPAYLLGQKRLPAELPAYYGVGDDSEAVVCAQEQLGAWQRTPGALAWLSASGRHTPALRRRSRGH